MASQINLLVKWDILTIETFSIRISLEENFREINHTSPASYFHFHRPPWANTFIVRWWPFLALLLKAGHTRTKHILDPCVFTFLQWSCSRRTQTNLLHAILTLPPSLRSSGRTATRSRRVSSGPRGTRPNAATWAPKVTTSETPKPEWNQRILWDDKENDYTRLNKQIISVIKRDSMFLICSRVGHMTFMGSWCGHWRRWKLQNGVDFSKKGQKHWCNHKTINDVDFISEVPRWLTKNIILSSKR